MKKLICALICIGLVLAMAACSASQETEPTSPPGGNGTSKSSAQDPPELKSMDEHSHRFAEEPQTVDDPIAGYCGNMITTVYLNGEEYSFAGSDSVNLTDIVINMKYDPLKVCRCIPEFTVGTESGVNYGIDLSHGFVRCEDGQADLTPDQVKMIGEIIENQT